MALLFCAAPAEPQKPAFTASQIEAAYLYNFAQFVEWPAQSFADSNSPLIIGILGKDPFGSILDQIVNGEKINGHPIAVRRFETVQDINACHVLFIAASEGNRVGQICSGLKNRHILTVSEIPDFARRGGMIELVEENERVRFRIALQRAREESLAVSAKLLSIAEVVSQFALRLEIVARSFPPGRRSSFPSIPRYPAGKFSGLGL